jgi:hypothetical protein
MDAQLYLDLDGVLADFEGRATALFDMPPKEYQQLHGQGRFWGRLAKTPDFYNTLELLPDAMELFEGVRHLDPIILTGLPVGKWAEPQKRSWVERHFPGTGLITTLARKKSEHCKPGDVLVDDQDKYRDLWETAGGVFILHRDARSTLEELRRIGMLSD